MIFRTMRPGEEEAWANFCSMVFGGEGDTQEYFLRHYRNDPHHEPEGIFIAEADGKIVSTVHVFRREIYIRGQRVKMGGVADVATLPEYRRTGLSGKLLTMAVEYMNANKQPVSLLFTGVNRHYARYGWFTHVMRYAKAAVSGAVLPGGMEIGPLKEEHYEEAAGLHGLTASRFSGVLVREHPGYMAWVKREIDNPTALTKDGRLVAYIGWDHWEDGVPHLTEYGALPGRDYYLTLLASAGGECAYIPSALQPESAEFFVESGGAMLRLNAPFYVGDLRIDTPGKLASAMEDMFFFDTDGF